MASIAICGLIYNSIVTHVTMKNDVKHLKDDNEEIKTRIMNIERILMEKEK